MNLPIEPPFPPMEAENASTLPTGDGWLYEPKWDGFRCVAFRDGDDVALQSKAGKPLARYFPDVVRAILALPSNRFVIDGEIVIPVDGTLSFDHLLLRIHPAASRVNMLARETPGVLIVFDYLVTPRGTSLLERPLSDRRQQLEAFAARAFSDEVRLSPATTDARQAERWLLGLSGADGVMAKRLEAPYLPGERRAMQKVKRLRTADCVVGGFRYASKGKEIGSLLLGLYDDDGVLHHVGFTGSMPASIKAEATRLVEERAGGTGFTGRAPGGPSRWSTERTTQWVPLRPDLVVEVQYDYFTTGRFRHGTRFLRWRPDKDPRQCTFEQVTRKEGSSLDLV